MKILVISDSHGRTGKLKMILIRNQDIDMIIHLGDGENDLSPACQACNIDLSKIRVFQVCGNCDRESNDNITITPTIEGVKFYITHGFEQGVKYGLKKIATLASYNDCKIALFGHTHRQHKSEEMGIMLFNPGSVMNGEYGIINVGNGNIECCELKAL